MKKQTWKKNSTLLKGKGLSLKNQIVFWKWNYKYVMGIKFRRT